MSIITKRGDTGETDLLFGKRAEKSSQRFQAMGAVDELNAALGLVRVQEIRTGARETIDSVQEKLVGLMGELATLAEDEERYKEAGYPQITLDDVAQLEQAAKETEDALNVRYKEWARPGKDASFGSAQLDFARTICRRAERELWAFSESSQPARLYLNRLSDLLWIFARAENVGL